MASNGIQAFEFGGGPFDGQLAVRGFSGTEALSRLYDFTLELVSATQEAVEIKELLGKDAQLLIHSVDGSPRYVHGIIARVENLGAPSGHHRYRARLVPRLWTLDLTRNSRIFQHLTAVEV